MVGWPHQFNGHEFEQTPGDSKGQGSLACCSPWGRKESDMTEQLNNNDKKINLKLSRETGIPRHRKSGSGAYCRCLLASREPTTVLCFQHAQPYSEDLHSPNPNT